MFNKITNDEIKAPVTRDLIKGNYDPKCSPAEIHGRLLKVKSSPQAGPLSESEFLNTADLREKQLFDITNNIREVVPISLQHAALRQIVNLLTGKFCQIRNKVGENRFNQFRTLELTKDLIRANAHFKNADWIDRLLIDFDKQVDAVCKIQKFDVEKQNKAQ